MAYGFKSRRKSAASTYRRTTFGVRAPFARRNLGKTKYFRSATTRRLNSKETKYDDDYFNLNAWSQFTQGTSTATVGSFTDWVLGGVVSTLNRQVASFQLANGTEGGYVRANSYAMTPNCLTNISSGTSAGTRIGNKVEPKYITIKGVATATRTTSTTDPETLDKLEGGTTDTLIERYCRTTMRILVIRDKNMNEKGYVEFSDVFSPALSGVTHMDNVSKLNPYLWNRKLDTIGRYDILKEAEFTMDQTDPQKSFNWTIPLKGIPIKFNGAAPGVNWRTSSIPESNTTVSGTLVTNGTLNGIGQSEVVATTNTDIQSMTNGIYVIAVAHTSNTGSTLGVYASPCVMFSTRCGFYDN